MDLKISAVEYYLPEKIVTNSDLAQHTPIDVNYIEDKLGISQRNFAGEKETAATMAVNAINNLIEKNKIKMEELEFLLVATQNPDNILPGIAPLIQNEMKLNISISAFDVNLACSAYPYLLSIASAYIKSGLFKKGLIVTSEIYSRRINLRDKNVSTLFGDAATATYVTSTEEKTTFGFDFGTDGSGYEHLIIPAGGIRLPLSSETSIEKEITPGVYRSLNNIYMNGKEIFSFVLDKVPVTVGNCVAKAGLKFDDIDYFVFHQANKYMLNTLGRKMEIPQDKLIIDICKYGNTVSSTIPIIISNMLKDKTLKNKKVLMCGFGVGLSYSTCIYQF